jgi:antitoxin FitA
MTSLKKGRIMASMTIRDLDDQLKSRLRMRAAKNNRSMEEEVRAILKSALAADGARSKSLIQAIRERIEPLGGIELEQPARESIRGIHIE